MNQLIERINELTNKHEETRESQPIADELNVDSSQLTLRKGMNKIS